MPRLKPSEREERKRIVRAVISGNKERYGVDDVALAAQSGVTDRTLRSRRDDPGMYRLEELWALARELRFTPTQAVSIVLGRDLTAKEIKDFILM